MGFPNSLRNIIEFSISPMEKNRATKLFVQSEGANTWGFVGKLVFLQSLISNDIAAKENM